MTRLIRFSTHSTSILLEAWNTSTRDREKELVAQPNPLFRSSSYSSLKNSERIERKYREVRWKGIEVWEVEELSRMQYLG